MQKQRLLGKTCKLLSIGVTIVALLIGTAALGGRYESGVVLAAGTKTIEWEGTPQCVDSPWHFLINNLNGPSSAPASITVYFSDNSSQTVGLDPNHEVKKVAFYYVSSADGVYPVRATAEVDASLDAKLVLSLACKGNTPTPTPTSTPQVPTATPTTTPEDPTATPTNTPEVPTVTPTATPEVPTATPTTTPEDPTATPTNTPEVPTTTPTSTPEGPTATPTNTPEGPTATPTSTPEGPTATPTNTPVPPTNTPVPPTNTPTNTPEAPGIPAPAVVAREVATPTLTPTPTSTTGTMVAAAVAKPQPTVVAGVRLPRTGGLPSALFVLGATSGGALLAAGTLLRRRQSR